MHMGRLISGEQGRGGGASGVAEGLGGTGKGVEFTAVHRHDCGTTPSFSPLSISACAAASNIARKNCRWSVWLDKFLGSGLSGHVTLHQRMYHLIKPAHIRLVNVQPPCPAPLTADGLHMCTSVWMSQTNNKHSRKPQMQPHSPAQQPATSTVHHTVTCQLCMSV